MHETTKATKRRNQDTNLNWKSLFSGETIDLGPGSDPIRKEDWPLITYLTLFDLEQGDATKLSQYFHPQQFDTIHASQMLEDVDDVEATLSEWKKCLSLDGHIIITVPDFTLYEQLQWPPVYNEGHKNTFSLDLKGSPAGNNHWRVGSQRWEAMLGRVGLTTEYLNLVDTNYDYSKLGSRIDQTLNPDDGVECYIEFILKKS
jgi:SAM-dependent methyltransferase